MMKEKDIRPPALFDAYLAAAREDIATFFPDSKGFVEVPCPACGEKEGVERFVKDRFRYVVCPRCRTLYASPRPPEDTLRRFYRESKSSAFWVGRFYKETEEARREKMFRPRARDVVEKTMAFLRKPRPAMADVGSGYGTFLEELAKLDYFSSLTGIEPSADLAAVCEGKGFSIVRSTIEEAPATGRFDLITSFELFEHVFSPLEFLRAVNRQLAPGGIFYMTTLSALGFDLLLLGERSKSLSPPHHLNFINPSSLSLALDRAGFEVLNVDTPGQLDVDIVLNAQAGNPVDMDAFTREILLESSELVRRNFQIFLQENGLSSHVRAMARKR